MRTTFLILLILSVGVVKAQEKYEIEAKVIDKQTKKPIRNVHVINLNNGYGAVSDTAGQFRILATPQDSLRFSAVGYKISRVSAMNFLGFLKKFTISLESKVYMLKDVEVFALTWNSFKDSVIADVVPEELWKEKRWIESIFTGEQLGELNLLANANRVITLNYTSREDEQREKVEELKEEDKEADIAESRFNKAMVGRITGIKDKALDDFFSSFSLSTERIQSKSDYELILEIQGIYKAYQKKMKEE